MLAVVSRVRESSKMLKSACFGVGREVADTEGLLTPEGAVGICEGFVCFR